MSPTAYAFFQGEYVPLAEAKVGIMTHALHYGTGVFEGIRGNWNSDSGEIYMFRLREHYERLLKGCRLLMIDLPYSLKTCATLRWSWWSAAATPRTCISGLSRTRARKKLPI